MEAASLSPGARIFITGGAGFIGSVVVRVLVGAGFRPRCLLRATTKTERLAGLPVERVEGDVRDAQAVRRGLDGCDAVIHLASLSSWNDIDSPLMQEVVLQGTGNVLDAARDTGPRRVVFVSSAVTINGSDTPQVHDETAAFELDDSRLSYCRNKRAAERRCLESGVPVVIVNPTEVYGPNDTALITAGSLVDFAKSSPVLVCRGGTSVAHVEDVAQGIVAALLRGRPGERYLLGGENLSVRELAELTLSILGKKAGIWSMPNGLLRIISRVALALRLPLPFNPRVIPYATRYWYMSSAKAQRELGVSFRSARAALEPTIGWLQSAGLIKGAVSAKPGRAA